MQIVNEQKLDFDSVLIRPKRSTLTTRNLNISRDYKFLSDKDKKWNGVPIIAANMDTTGTMEMAIALGKLSCMTALHKHYSIEDISNFFNENPELDNLVFYTLGMGSEDFKKLEEYGSFHDRMPSMICIDVANGYIEAFSEYVNKVRNICPKSVIMAGNVVTGDMTQQLLLAGADIIKVGIGPGSVCTTRKVTGVGYPQLSAIIECADAAHGMNGHICGDGGCTNPGDVSKAFGGGADFVMLGGMLSGHDECSGTILKNHDGMFKEFYGMSSEAAMNKYNGGVNNYRSPEGKKVLVPYKGDVTTTMNQILGGVRSTMTYVGATELKHLSKCTTFVIVENQLNNIFTGNEHE